MKSGRENRNSGVFGTRFERSGGPEAILFPKENHRSVRQRASLTAIRCRRVRVQSRVAIGFGAVGGAGSHRVLGLFFRTVSTIVIWDLGGPRGQTNTNKSIDLRPTESWRLLANLSDVRDSRSDPTSHARIPRMT